MKVILTKDVPGVGRRGDVKNVSDGYARNYLMRNGLAQVATEQTLAKARAMQDKIAQERKDAEAKLSAGLKEVNGKNVVIPAKASEEGSLFAGIDAKSVVFAIKNAHDVNIPEDAVMLETPIKSLGKHPVVIKSGDTEATVTLEIVSES